MNTSPYDNSGDRISLTIIFALLIHAALILGITFSADLTLAPDEELPTLDVILVQKSATKAPDKADYLAQASQLGGGSSQEKVRPTAPLTGPALKAKPGLAPLPSQAAAPKPEPRSQSALVTTLAAERQVAAEKPDKQQPERELPSASQMLFQAREIARLEAELGQQFQTYAQRNRHKYITASTQEYLYASYMHSWVSKVERIGSLNYPAAARQENIHGSLVLDVGINWNGEVSRLKVLKSSGHEVLDQAAIRIVRMAAPYTPLPAEIRETTDILHIVRTWQFLAGDEFGSGG